MDVFLHLFPDALLEMIVVESNKYARQVMEEEEHWCDIDVEEIKAYLGFNIMMGIVQLPEIEDYWKQDPFYHYDPIASRISRDRFKDISRYLHFVDNGAQPQLTRGQPGFDRLCKVKPVINAVQTALLAAYNPSREVVVDEAMIPFKG